MGRYSSCRRVARTIYMASAPTVKTSSRGTDDRHIRLGCVQPGETVATFGDALRRLTDQAMHLYVDKNRYWYNTQPSVLSVAKDRAVQLNPDEVMDEIVRRIKQEQRRSGDFALVHACPAASSDVADEYDARLVILGPMAHHVRNRSDSPAMKFSEEILLNRGGSPRQYRNSLVFLAPEKRQLESLEHAVRDYLAWQSIERDKGANALNLDAFQVGQAETKRDQADEIVKQRIPEAWQCVITPNQDDPKSDQIEWKVYKPMGVGSLTERTAARLKREEALIVNMAGARLKIELDRVPLWRGNHVELRQLAEDFASYVYLPRLQGPRILAEATENGVGLITWQTDSFAYADNWDEENERYVGLRAGQSVSMNLDGGGVLVQSAIAADQMEKDKAAAGAAETGVDGESGFDPGEEAAGGDTGGGLQPEGESKGPEPAKPKRYYGTVKLDPTRMTRDVGNITDEVIQHLTSLLGSEVTVSLDIHAKVPGGVEDHIVRIVTENSRTLKFDEYGFEDE